MIRLEDLTPGSSIKGILPNETVKIIKREWIGTNAIEIVYQDSNGKLGSELLYREKESSLEVVQDGLPWSFDADGYKFRLVSEASRIRLAHIFDPMLAIHTSLIEPLPHQITAVYGEMLPRQPLRFLLADDPGAGKTIMAGLFIKELIVRGDLERCLICCPGNLADQWQDELKDRFHLEFKIISNQTIEDAIGGNPYIEFPFVISRMDHMARNESILAKLKQSEWDLVVVDEAHKMSAHYYGNEKKETKRYRLGKLLGSLARTRHFLLMTATPHNGKEEDFQLFMALLDSDRFEGRFRDGVHVVDTSDVMRRLIKEQLEKFDGTPLFPERKAYSVNYRLSDEEANLYWRVTDYVREEMNRVDRLTEEGEGKRGNRIGFALTSLQRRLASSPEAIYQSLRRRRERLEKRLREEKILKRGAEVRLEESSELSAINSEVLEELDDAPDVEVEDVEERLVEQASAARTIAELEREINILKDLETLAAQVRNMGKDKKWEELSSLLQNNPEMLDSSGNLRKLIIFTEHRDTLKYLCEKIRTLLGRSEDVVTIHGGIKREERRKVQELFTQDKEVHVLVATDAAGEGINLQRAHLMVNYDLPWNPNRLEQRFGRIHRIGQTEICHMWSLVAEETREGDVFNLLLIKLETEQQALGGKVFDILGQIFQGTALRDLLIEAIREGKNSEVRDDIRRKMESAFDRDEIKKILQDRALAHDVLSPARILEIKEEMDRAEARRLQPHFIRSFFLEAFRGLGGTVHKRESDRYEITRVPPAFRHRDRQIGIGHPVLNRYERISFDKEFVNLPGKPLASLVCPGHPLLDTTIELLLEQNRTLLKQGTILIDRSDETEDVRVLFYLSHAIQDARSDRHGNRRIVSRRMQFVEINASGEVKNAGPAPYLDYEPLHEEEIALVRQTLQADWLKDDLEKKANQYAVEYIVPAHYGEVKQQKESLIEKTMKEVHKRLTQEINYWDHRAEELKLQEEAGKTPPLNSAKARQRADELQARLRKRKEELEQELQLSPKPPTVMGGALIVPKGLFERLQGQRINEPALFANETRRIETLAMEAVMQTERQLGREPRDVSQENCGYDIESKDPQTGYHRFIEVKGRVADAKEVTITKNEIMTGFNKPDQYILAIVLVDGDTVHKPAYIYQPFQKEPDFAAASVNYKLKELLSRSLAPE